MRAMLSVALVLFFAVSVHAASQVDDGNVAFMAGDFQRAVSLYEAAVDSGIRHEDLYYNLGNAYLRNNNLGKAIYNYERALRLDSDMSDARFNLRVARQVVSERAEDKLRGAQEEPLWVRVVTAFSVSQLTVVFLVANALLFAGLGFLRFWATGFARAIALVLTLTTGFVVVGSVLLLNRHLYVLDNLHQAIVVVDSVLLREGPHGRAAERGEVHAGLRVRIQESNGAWSRIELANGVEGWVPVSSVNRL